MDVRLWIILKFNEPLRHANPARTFEQLSGGEVQLSTLHHSGTKFPPENAGTFFVPPKMLALISWGLSNVAFFLAVGGRTLTYSCIMVSETRSVRGP